MELSVWRNVDISAGRWCPLDREPQISVQNGIWEKKRKKREDRKKKKEKHKKKEKNKESRPETQVGPVTSGHTLNAENVSDEAVQKSMSMKPMTKEEWEKQQSIVRRVYDPETGRNRLVKGDGEILEEIVSKDRHKEINKMATQGDGLFYQKKTGLA